MMIIPDPISVPDAAKVLEVSPTRARAMAARGQIRAAKVGGRWLLERSDVELRRDKKVPGGRPFTPRNAWAVLQLLSDEEVPDLSSSARSRLKRMLLNEGIEALAPRLSVRAQSFLYQGHAGELANVRDDPALRPTGVTAAAIFGIVGPPQVDGYLSAADHADFVQRHALVQAASANVQLRIVPEEVWPSITRLSLAPQAAALLDLTEQWDPRLKETGIDALETLERTYREAAKARR